ncbi:MAG TPA: CBS domain-containing protein [Candidatus Deferrimicrobium sp.]|nr:CBS domain-containing protein [Candidatus Deferrimicrobium sp.]
MKVKDILREKDGKLVTAQPAMNVLKAMELIIGNRISCLPVLDASGQLVGIISDKDIFRAVYEHQETFRRFTVGDLMTTNLIVGVADDDVDYIGGVMTKNRFRHVPIVDKAKLIGLISVGDIVKAQIKQMEIENRYLKLYMEGNYPG